MSLFIYKKGDENRLNLIDPKILRKSLRNYDFWKKYYRAEIHGIENIPKKGKALLVSNHAFGNADAPLLLKFIYEETGRLPRGLTAHEIWKIPIIREWFISCGAVDGNQENAIKLLNRDDLVLVYPGGAKDFVKASKDRYKLKWEGQNGFIKVALKTRSPIIPIASIGPDDTFYRPIDGYKLGEKLFGIKNLSIPIAFGFGILPFPAKFTYYIGSPIRLRYPPEAATDAKIVERAHKRIWKITQDLIDEGLRKRETILCG